MNSKEVAVRVGTALITLSGLAAGCGLAGNGEKSASTIPTKPIPTAGATPVPTPDSPVLNIKTPSETSPLLMLRPDSNSTLVQIPLQPDEKGSRIWIFAHTTASEAVLDEDDAKGALRATFQPDFLKANLGEEFSLNLVESLTDGVTKEYSERRMKRWQLPSNPNSHIQAEIVATFGRTGVITATVEGKVTGIFPWGDKKAPVVVKSGEGATVVEEIQKSFRLKERVSIYNFDRRMYSYFDEAEKIELKKRASVYLSDQREFPDSGELIDLIFMVFTEGRTAGGRPIYLTVMPDGSFRYSLYQK